VAKPKDFGFYGKGEGGGDGRYTPFKTAASHQRLRDDLSRMIGLMLAGRKDEARSHGVSADAGEVGSIPSFSVTDLDGKPLGREDLVGRVALVEFWATWCPPCRGTLAWLGELKKQHGDKVAIVAIAIESEEQDVRGVATELGIPIRWALGTPEAARAFGDVSAVPTLLVFDRAGRAAGAFYGAPPTLHQDVEAALGAAIR